VDTRAGVGSKSFPQEVYNLISFRRIVAALGLSLLASAVPLLTTQGTARASLAIAYPQYLWPQMSGVASAKYTITP
jgi:hypothetical protein